MAIHTAIILAAGEGKRAWPFAGIRQKVTVPVANIPLVRRIALDLTALGVNDLVVVIGHRAEAVRACLADIAGVRYVEQRMQKGSGDAALCGLSALSSDSVLVCAGDIATSRENFGLLLDSHAESKAEVSILCASCPPGLTASCASVEINARGRVEGIWARGGSDAPRFGGALISRRDTLDRALRANPGIMNNVGIGAMPPLESDLAHSTHIMCETGVEVLPVMARDYFVDVDKPWHIVEASLAAMRHELSLLERTIIEPGASIDDGANIASDARLWLKRGAHIGRGCHVKGNVILEENAQVTCGGILGKDVMLGRDSKCNEYGAVKSGSVMGRECVVSHCAEFEGVAFDVVYLYHYCCVTALLGCNVDIGAATVCGTWRFDDGKRVHDFGGRKESPECHANKTYIGDYSRTGVNVMFMPGVKVGHYCCVGAGAIVYDDIPDGTLLLPKQEHVTQPWGPERYGW